MIEYYLIVAAFFSIVIVIGIFAFWRDLNFRKSLAKREEDMRRKMYELSILKELGDRMGYSLNTQNIVDIITNSLHQFIDYSAVSYMLLEPEKIIFKVHLEKSISSKFIGDVRNRMLNSLSALSNTDLQKMRVEEVFSGAILAEGLEEPVKSFFNIPLVIAKKLVGVLTVSDVKPGLYKEEEMTILYKITNQASNAVSRLLEVVKTEQGKLNAMVESMTEGVVMTDKDYRVMVVNPAARRAVGLDEKAELTIFNFIEKLEGKFNFREKIEESVKLDKIMVSPEVFIQERYFQISTAPVKGITGLNQEETLGCIVIFHDITSEKKAEKMKEDFTSMIVHELRSPLNADKKMIDLIRDGSVGKKQELSYFQMIYKSSSEMLELIDNLLDMAKMEAGKFEIQKTPSDIKQTIAGRVSFFKTSAKDAKLKLVSHFSDNIPEAVNFDQSKIIQVLNNFLSNALKFNKEKGIIDIQVLFHKNGYDIKKEAGDAQIAWFLKNKLVDLEKLPDSLIIAVTDSGLGIPPEGITKLFNKFTQVKNTFTERAGTGLGLAIIRDIIDSHGGVVGVESIEGQGSTFYFTIPVT